MLQLDGRSVDFIESGTGPTVLFLPGSFSTPAAWKAVQRLLPPRWRLAGTSLLGYGATSDTRRPGDLDMAHEVAAVVAVARHLGGGPLHLVGHSFGGTVALATALSGEVAVASLALFEANPLDLLLSAGEPALHAEALALSRRFAAAVAAGEPAAAGLIIDYWGGAGSFAALPEAVRDYCRRSAPANALDWPTCFGFRAGPADYARLTLPVLLARGALANPAMRAITASLAAALPGARPAVVPGASHFLIASHAADCAGLLGRFLAEVTP